MRTGRFLRSLLAILASAIGILCLSAAYQGLGAAPVPAATGSAVLTWVLAICGSACLLGSLLVWMRLFDRPRVGTQEALRFGRHAVGSAANRSRLVPVLAVVTIAGIAALAAELSGLLRSVDDPSRGPATGEPAVVQMPSPEAAPPEPAGPEEVEPEPHSQPTGEQETAAARPAASERAPEAVPPQTPPAVTSVPMPTPDVLPTQAEGHHDAVVWLSLAPDGRSFLSTSTDRTIKLWDLAARTLTKTVASHSDMARVAVFLPDGERIVTAGDDGEIVMRNLSDGAPLHVFSTKDHGGVNKIAISADGRRMVSGHEAGTVLFWDLEKRAALHVERAHGWPVAGVAISADGRRALSGSIDGDLKLWDVESGDLIRYWGGHERGAYGMAFTRDGRQAVTGSGDRTIKLWDLESGRLLRQFDGHSQTVYAIALSNDDTRILSGSLDGTARLWDLENGTEIAQYVGHRGPVYSVAFGPEGTVLTGGYDRAIRIWREAGPPAVAVLAGAPK